MTQRSIAILATLTVMMAAPLAAQGQGTAGVEQDLELIRFVRRAEAWYPDSVFQMTSDERGQTPSGAYRLVSVERTCDSKTLSGTTTLLVDEVANTVWLGTVARLPFRQAGVEPSGLGRFLQQFLPEVMQQNLGLRVKVDWGSGPHRPGAMIPFWLLVDTGYGDFRKEAAVTSDGEYLMLGSGFPIDQDPVAVRRQLLSGSELVVWDHGGGQEAVEVVEFSDLECPACRGRWPLVKQTIEARDGKVRHGMVSFPLTTIHPWAFRSACASWCVAEQDPQFLIPFKDLFYSLQTEMEVSLVTPTSLDFVAGNGLDESTFRSCYLRQQSLDAVHGQLALGSRLGVLATPTYFVNGWKVQVPGEDWFPGLIDRLLAGDDLS